MVSFGNFTLLCKGLSVVLIVGHLICLYFPPVASYLALIPAKTIPFAWNLITSGYFEQTTEGVVISTLALLFTGKLLDPIWGSKELFRFIFLVNFMTSICVFITTMFLYYITNRELYIYLPISGFQGAVAGLLVGIKQVIPNKELPLLRIKAKWLPSLAILGYVISCFFRITEAVSYIPTFIFGAYTGWIYLRYWQKKPELKFRGDTSEDFSFSSFFPEFLRGIIDPIATAFARVFCRRKTELSDESGDVASGGDNSVSRSLNADEARRREKGARVLQERLAAERSPARGRQTHQDALENV